MESSLQAISQQLKNLNSETKILAVSKLQSTQAIRDLFSQGQRSFGENYVQEALAKQAELKDLPIDWHFIGSLQTNKVKFVVGQFSLIHSVDSLKLAQAIDKQACKLALQQKILLQVNLSFEDSKGGFSESELIMAMPHILSLKNIELRGLMTMPPLFVDPKQARPYFAQLKKLRDSLRNKNNPMPILSMGTSSDYLVAAQEGADIVRLGSILFGARPKK